MQEALEEDTPEGLERVNEGIPHIIRRAALNPDVFADDFLPFPKELTSRINLERLRERDSADETDEEDSDNVSFRRQKRAKNSQFTVELSMFFDEAGYNIFAPYLNNNDQEMRDMLLAYMNGVSLISTFSLGSLGRLTSILLRTSYLDSFLNMVFITV